jgi:hypothetical protein
MVGRKEASSACEYPPEESQQGMKKRGYDILLVTLVDDLHLLWPRRGELSATLAQRRLLGMGLP